MRGRKAHKASRKGKGGNPRTPATPGRGQPSVRGLAVSGAKARARLDKARRGGEEQDTYARGGWIKGAIKKPGALKASAKRAGMSTHEFAEAHKHDSGKTGNRARLALTLGKMNKK